MTVTSASPGTRRRREPLRARPVAATRAPVPPRDAALTVEHLDFAYGHVQILFDVSISVGVGETLALLGTNGAGKSTLLRAVSGLSSVQAGRILHRDVDVTTMSAVDRVGRGIVQLPGGKAVFPSLTVMENLLAGAYGIIWNRAELRDRITVAVDRFPILRARLNQRAGTLSGGEQQMLALAKALLLEPDVLCIDELSLGLAPVVVAELLETVAGLKADGITMVIVEQSLNVALAMADRAVFMEKGQVRFEGPAQELAERDDLARAVFLGGEGG